MLDEKKLIKILSNVEYKPGFSFKANWDKLGTDNWIQVCIVDGENFFTCRKWRISVYMTESEVVQTAFLAIKTAEEHETREKFLYKGNAVFNPHINVNVLGTVCDSLEVR